MNVSGAHSVNQRNTCTGVFTYAHFVYTFSSGKILIQQSGPPEWERSRATRICSNIWESASYGGCHLQGSRSAGLSACPL